MKKVNRTSVTCGTMSSSQSNIHIIEALKGLGRKMREKRERNISKE